MDTINDFAEYLKKQYIEPYEAFKKKQESGLIIELPVPIGEKVYIPYKYKGLNGSVNKGVEITRLSGYVKENDKDFYITSDNFCGLSFYKPNEIYITMEAAEARLKEMELEVFSLEQKCRVCGCTWDNACEGGCYWVEPDLCSACADKSEAEGE